MRKFKFRKITALVLVFAMMIGMSGNVFAEVKEKVDTNSFNAAQENLIQLDVDEALTNGVYSNDRKYVVYDNNMFVVADLIKAQLEIRQLEAKTKNKQISTTFANDRIAYEYQSSGIFYSRGPQHVLGRITLSPSQTGSFSSGKTFNLEVSVSGGVSKSLFTAGVSFGYTQSYTITTTIDVENIEDRQQTAVLSRVFMVHDYNVYDKGFWLDSYDYQGSGQIYEPYSEYTYWE